MKKKQIKLSDHYFKQLGISVIFLLITAVLIPFFLYKTFLTCSQSDIIYIEGYAIVSIISAILAIILIIENIFRVNYDKDPNHKYYFDIHSNELGGSNVLEFYKGFSRYIIKEDTIFFELQFQVRISKMILFIFISIFGFLCVIGHRIFILTIIGENGNQIQNFLIGFCLTGIICFSSAKTLKKLNLQKEQHIQILSIEFSENINSKGLNFTHSPKSKKHREIIQFIELANSLSNIFQNYRIKLKRSFFHVGIHLIVGLTLFIFNKDVEFYVYIGLGLIFIGLLFFIIYIIRFLREKELSRMTQIVLNSYVIPI